jgi:hypothetical protein
MMVADVCLDAISELFYYRKDIIIKLYLLLFKIFRILKLQNISCLRRDTSSEREHYNHYRLKIH